MKARQGNTPTATTKDELDQLDQERERLGITLAEVAQEASKTSKRKHKSVSVPTVSRALSGATRSANVVSTVRRLIRERRKSKKTAAA